MAVPGLRTNPGSGRSRGRRESTLPDRRPEPGRILPLPAASRIQAGCHESAEPDATHRAALARVWLLPRACRTGASGLAGESQTHSASDANRQLTAGKGGVRELVIKSGTDRGGRLEGGVETPSDAAGGAGGHGVPFGKLRAGSRFARNDKLRGLRDLFRVSLGYRRGLVFRE